MKGSGDDSSRQSRYSRLCNQQGRIFMIPLDHGMSMGPMDGIAPISQTLDAVAEFATCTTVHKGLVAQARRFQDQIGVLMHLSASTDRAPDPHDKRIVATVAEAVSRGADAVSVHINLGSKTEANQIEAVGRVSGDCHDLAVPLVVMAYPRGPEISNPIDPELVAHAARLAAELGADAVKVPFTGNEENFRPVVEGAGIPVIIAGGPKRAQNELLADARAASRAGAAGVSIGRNIFQAKDPKAAIQSITECFP